MRVSREVAGRLRSLAVEEFRAAIETCLALGMEEHELYALVETTANAPTKEKEDAPI